MRGAGRMLAGLLLAALLLPSLAHAQSTRILRDGSLGSPDRPL